MSCSACLVLRRVLCYIACCLWLGRYVVRSVRCLVCVMLVCVVVVLVLCVCVFGVFEYCVLFLNVWLHLLFLLLCDVCGVNCYGLCLFMLSVVFCYVFC